MRLPRGTRRGAGQGGKQAAAHGAAVSEPVSSARAVPRSVGGTQAPCCCASQSAASRSAETRPRAHGDGGWWIRPGQGLASGRRRARRLLLQTGITSGCCRAALHLSRPRKGVTDSKRLQCLNSWTWPAFCKVPQVSMRKGQSMAGPLPTKPFWQGDAFRTLSGPAHRPTPPRCSPRSASPALTLTNWCDDQSPIERGSVRDRDD